MSSCDIARLKNLKRDHKIYMQKCRTSFMKKCIFISSALETFKNEESEKDIKIANKFTEECSLLIDDMDDFYRYRDKGNPDILTDLETKFDKIYCRINALSDKYDEKIILKNECAALLNEIENAPDHLKNIMADFSENTTQRCKLIRDQIKKTYHDILKAKETLSKETEEALCIDSQKTIRDALANLGYKAMISNPEHALFKGEVVYFETEHPDYRIMARYTKETDEVVFRFIRMVPEGFEKTSYENEKDIEQASKWCGNIDKFMAKLHAEGLDIVSETRIEPWEEKGITYIVDKSLEETNGKYAERRIDHTRTAN